VAAQVLFLLMVGMLLTLLLLLLPQRQLLP
jgi:hypothetical protein